MIVEQATAVHVVKAEAGVEEAAAEVVAAYVEAEPPEQSYHQQESLRTLGLLPHQQVEEWDQAAEDINPTGASDSTTETIVTAVGVMYPTGTRLHRS